MGEGFQTVVYLLGRTPECFKSTCSTRPALDSMHFLRPIGIANGLKDGKTDVSMMINGNKSTLILWSTAAMPCSISNAPRSMGSGNEGDAAGKPAANREIHGRNK